MNMKPTDRARARAGRIALNVAAAALYARCDRIDVAIKVREGIWLHPDQHDDLRGLDRAALMRAAPRLWARNLPAADGADGGGCEIYCRPTAPAAFVLLDDLAPALAARIARRYSTLLIQTHPGSVQAWIECTQPLTPPERHAVQSAIVKRLDPGAADPGATGGGQLGRLPGFINHKRGGVRVVVIGTPWCAVSRLDPLSLSADRVAASSRMAPQRAVTAPWGRVGACSRPGVPARRNGGKGQGRNPGQTDESAIDYFIACDAIRKSCDAESIIAELADRALARGKRDNHAAATEYANRTYSKALAAVRDDCRRDQ
ncbi:MULTISPECIES: DNA-primase RepB domain-containing protein [Metallibacterium]|jgi:hypothetical protein|uniref:DNA-primase RepB domain-containing protein n=1 Tax=Metallibacterium TaxID=1218803 RepID=UPI0026322FC6|nr:MULTISPECIES: DNA-primase RepB domain-containing protein [Metallibacterium]MBW8075269.1 hypothetical protein [Metallibacterium scheffleri]